MRLDTDAGTYEARCVGPGDMAEIHLADAIEEMVARRQASSSAPCPKRSHKTACHR